MNIAERVRKLLALADQERNPSEAEAAAALAKAMELIERYGLTSEDYGEQHEELVAYRREDYAVRVLDVTSKQTTWRSVLAQTAALATGCSGVVSWVGNPTLKKVLGRDCLTRIASYESKAKAYTVTGREEDVSVAAALYEYLSSTCDKLARSHVTRSGGGRAAGHSYRISYAQGAYAQVAARGRRQRDELGDRALAVVDNGEENLRTALGEIWGNLTLGRKFRYQKNKEAYERGSSAYLGRDTVGGSGAGSGLGLGDGR